MNAKGRLRGAAAIILAALLSAGAARAGAQALFLPSGTRQGAPLVAWLSVPDPVSYGLAALNDSEGKAWAKAEAFYMPSDGDSPLYGFLIPVPMSMPVGKGWLDVRLRLVSGGVEREVSFRAPIEVGQSVFASEDIALDAATGAIRSKPDPERDAQSREFAKLFEGRDSADVFARERMQRPLSGEWRVTSNFGDRRRYLYADGGVDASVHGGLDLGAPAGTPVLACAPGRVVFAEPRILTGNTIVIEHLPGLFSLYMHLSAIDVAPGRLVASGQRIGAVGSTGFSTGPHLHWELRIGSVPVDPEYWLATAILEPIPKTVPAVGH